MRSRLGHLPRAADGPKVALTQWATTESLTLADGTRIDQFALRDQTKQDVDGPLGRGTRLRIIGLADSQVEKTTAIELLESYPGLALYRVSYRNLSPHPISIRSWTNSELHLPLADARAAVSEPSDPPFWSCCGSTHPDRRDWVQPVKPGFEQQNFMGMSASDYGGGTPIVDVWRRDCGIAIGHLELTPRPVSLPVSCHDTGVDLAIVSPLERTLQPGEKFETHETFVATHTGDYFAVLNSYRQIMGARGLASPNPPQSAYDAIWCAWGNERDFTLQLIAD